jgi:hypothetical protein
MELVELVVKLSYLAVPKVLKATSIGLPGAYS